MKILEMIMVVGLLFVASGHAGVQSDQKEGDETKQTPNVKQPVVAPSVAKPGQSDDAEETVEMSDEVKADIVKLITINSELKTRFLYLLNSFYQLKSRTPGVKNEFWSECQNMITKDKLADRMAPVYAKHYTAEEIKGLIEFFESPLGKKFIDKSALVSSELNVETNQFGVEVGDAIKLKLDEEGYAR